jgi:hypothetical protein
MYLFNDDISKPVSVPTNNNLINEAEDLEVSGRGLTDLLPLFCLRGDEKTRKEPQYSLSLNPNLNLGLIDYKAGILNLLTC